MSLDAFPAPVSWRRFRFARAWRIRNSRGLCTELSHSFVDTHGVSTSRALILVFVFVGVWLCLTKNSIWPCQALRRIRFALAFCVHESLESSMRDSCRGSRTEPGFHGVPFCYTAVYLPCRVIARPIADVNKPISPIRCAHAERFMGLLLSIGALISRLRFLLMCILAITAFLVSS